MFAPRIGGTLLRLSLEGLFAPAAMRAARRSPTVSSPKESR
jgi:hypothetical protein